SWCRCYSFILVNYRISVLYYYSTFNYREYYFGKRFIPNKISLYDPECCLILKLVHLNLSTSPFFFTVEPYLTLADYSVFKCSGIPEDYLDQQPCTSDKAIFAIDSSSSLYYLPPTTCKKIIEIPSVPYDIVYNDLQLRW
uniref:RING-H2 finger protein ATL20-like n=1 Tax=Nicotiana sylvestris TaxID=4096 RepID=A0A1U7VY09_NICSY